VEEELRKLVEYAEKDIFACSSPNDLLNVKAKYLGKKKFVELSLCSNEKYTG